MKNIVVAEIGKTTITVDGGYPIYTILAMTLAVVIALLLDYVDWHPIVKGTLVTIYIFISSIGLYVMLPSATTTNIITGG